MPKNDFSNVDEYIRELIENSKGEYINQTVSFKKDNEDHINLLRFVLANARNISAFYRHLIKDKVQNSPQQHSDNAKEFIQNTPVTEESIISPTSETKEIPIKRIEKEPIKLTMKEDQPKRKETTNIQGFF